MSTLDSRLRNVMRDKLTRLRAKALDLSARNPLISTSFAARSTAIVRVVDELPDVLAHYLRNQKPMRVIPLPPLEDNPADERTPEFRQALARARQTDDDYLSFIAGREKVSLSRAQDRLTTKLDSEERKLRDKVRAQLELPPRPGKSAQTLEQHAKSCGLNPSYELPRPAKERPDRHVDDQIQTLLLPDDLERRLTALATKCRTWEEETGINVLHLAFGFLRWNDPLAKRKDLRSPLALLPVKLERKKGRHGPEFWIRADGDDLAGNFVLAEKLKQDFGALLPEFEAGASVEDYLRQAAEELGQALDCEVLREAALGVFPSAKMAIWSDLSPDKAWYETNPIVRDLLCGRQGVDAGRALTGQAPIYDVDAASVEYKTRDLVLDADSSQLSAVCDVVDGLNLALEGPPGTGKSQTIINALAAALAQGKKTLFVAEKMAALEVVKSRLEAVGLGEFLLPLQAARAERAQVVEGIRKRLTMPPPPPAPDCWSQRNRLERAKGRLRNYIDLVSRPFGQTGLSVQQVLGLALSTAWRLENAPRGLAEPGVDDPESFDRFKLEAVRKAGKALETAAELTRRLTVAGRDHWRGTAARDLAGLQAKRLLSLTGEAAEAFAAAAARQAELGAFRLEGCPAELWPDLIDELRALNRDFGTADFRLAAKLDRDGERERVGGFLEKCAAYQSNAAFLNQEIAAPVDEEAWRAVNKISELMAGEGIAVLDRQALAAELAARRAETAAWRSLWSQLGPVVAAFPETAAVPAGDLARLGRLIAALDRRTLALTLALRRHVPDDPLALADIAELKAAGYMLVKERRRLRATFAEVEGAESPEELGDHVERLENPGWLGRLAPGFRRAKALWRRLTGGREFVLDEATVELQALARWRRQARAFVNDERARRLFGHLFKGLETDFALFDRLIDFRQKVNDLFPVTTSRAARELALTADAELLQSLPAAGCKEDRDGVSRLAHDQLGLWLDAREAKLDARARTIESLKRLADNFLKRTAPELTLIRRLAARLREQLAARQELADDARAAAALGARFAGPSTRVQSFRPEFALLAWLDAMEGDLRAWTLNYLETPEPAKAAAAAEDFVQALAEARMRRQAVEEVSGLDWTERLSGLTLAGQATFAREAAGDERGLLDFSALAAARASVVELGLGRALAAFEQAKPSFKDFGDVLEALVYRAMSDKIYAVDGPRLSAFTANELDDLRDDLARMDLEILQAARLSLRHKLFNQAAPPQGVGAGLKSDYTELALLRHETVKKKQHLPVRKLVGRAARALMELKPCWMMSPAAVSQYLEAEDLTFDLVVLDEASQTPPENAIPSLARARQIMIVGDVNQLPPTTFFQRQTADDKGDEDEGDEGTVEESVLELAQAVFRPRRLMWHYRSRHSSLIEFSNREVYEGSLTVFPSPTEKRPGMGVKLVEAEGLYKSGLNPIEASRMAEAALKHMRTEPNRSLGLVTLNQKQRDLIIEILEQAIGEDAVAAAYVDDWKSRNDGLESFFVKNLENVQGDERDVMFIGTVYGPETAGGLVSQRFGPVQGQAGRRRLNVLFTRAKQQIVVFSSMTAADVKAVDGQKTGQAMLKAWLEYAKAGGRVSATAAADRTPATGFEAHVLSEIDGLGFKADHDVGASGCRLDAAVKAPAGLEAYVLGAECDGPSWSSTRSARDRDRLRDQVLEGLGWRLHRCWSSAWFADPGRERERLRLAIEQGVPGPPPPPTGPFVEVGDRVTVRCLENQRVVEYVLDKSDAPGVLKPSSPLGQALLGSKEQAVVGYIVGNSVKRVVIEKIVKG
ncbi:MAG: DUF4011 domain-containing protein, partial [Deltaproteobacteria bacterium]|nr:DUF4011 domain-containing protein [Deltaproteobacteria bacterium]